MYDLFADFFNSFDVVPVYREDRRCENCGRTYYEFQKSGRLGCTSATKRLNRKFVKHFIRCKRAQSIRVKSRQSLPVKFLKSVSFLT